MERYTILNRSISEKQERGSSATKTRKPKLPFLSCSGKFLREIHPDIIRRKLARQFSERASLPNNFSQNIRARSLDSIFTGLLRNKDDIVNISEDDISYRIDDDRGGYDSGDSGIGSSPEAFFKAKKSRAKCGDMLFDLEL